MKQITGTSGYVYTNDETPEERLRNKLSPLFLAIEVADNGDCNKKIISEAVKTLPDILMHLEDIEQYYKEKYEK